MRGKVWQRIAFNVLLDIEQLTLSLGPCAGTLSQIFF